MNIKINNLQIGDLVWIPANTSLMYEVPREEDLFWKQFEKKEPVVGLVTNILVNNLVKVLVGSEQYYVRKKQIYGVTNDY